MRYFLTIEYDGTPFVGWQIQKNGISIQEVLEKAISTLDSRRVHLQCAGRTDAGVHALGQVAHCDLAKERPIKIIRDAINSLVKPHPISVVQVTKVDPHMHARFSATCRNYLYRISNRNAPPALDRQRIWYRSGKLLDVDIMNDAAKTLIGLHDFSTFRAAGCQAKSPWRTLMKLEASQYKEEIHIYASARSFLHNQVRSLVGSLCYVGAGKWSVNDLQKALNARNRCACGPVAPACGLYLMRIDY